MSMFEGTSDDERVCTNLSPVLANIDFSKCGIDALLRQRGEEYTAFFPETAEGRPLQSCLL